MILPPALKWLEEKITQHSNYPERFESIGALHTWIAWAIENHFVVMNHPPTYVIIARPGSLDILDTCPKGEELWIFDHTGDSLWMDFLWAPGQWETVVAFLNASGKRWGGWEHRVTGKVHIVEIPKLISHHYQLPTASWNSRA